MEVELQKKLIFLRGVPGSGKSTYVQTVLLPQIESEAGTYVIHSTDSIIEEKGDYFQFFQGMKDRGDFSGLKQMHEENQKRAEQSLQNQDIQYVIIDNTNIKPWEMKSYVQMGISNGVKQENIQIVNITEKGLKDEDLQVFAQRNAHGVPIEAIKNMYTNYSKFYDTTVEDILNS